MQISLMTGTYLEEDDDMLHLFTLFIPLHSKSPLFLPVQWLKSVFQAHIQMLATDES